MHSGYFLLIPCYVCEWANEQHRANGQVLSYFMCRHFAIDLQRLLHFQFVHFAVTGIQFSKNTSPQNSTYTARLFQAIAMLGKKCFFKLKPIHALLTVSNYQRPPPWGLLPSPLGLITLYQIFGEMQISPKTVIHQDAPQYIGAGHIKPHKILCFRSFR